MKDFFTRGPAPLIKARFIERPNRFVLICELEGLMVKAHLPNPGRLQELLLPGCTIYLSGNPGQEERKTPYTAVAVKKGTTTVMLHTHRTNDVVQGLIEEGLVPSLKGAVIKGREVKRGHSRFDFLLSQGGREIMLEVKSCTLFGESLAMFPDAKTERGARHIRELAHLAAEGAGSAVLFLIQCGGGRYFLPDFHTDLEFARTFMECRDRVTYIPLALGWNDFLEPLLPPREVEIPWALLDRECHDRGSYLLLIHLEEPFTYEEGTLRGTSLEPAHYIYTGSAMAHLSKRIERHRRKEKKFHWHIDYLRDRGRVLADFPVRASDDLECIMAQHMAGIADFAVSRFGCSDCSCRSHLFGFHLNPLGNPQFISILQYLRIDRLSDMLPNY
jgi:sugar fermentation stimulation protein A